MRMKQCVVVVCNRFHSTEHPHFLGLYFDIYTEVLKFHRPSLAVVKMMLQHSKTILMVEDCNE